MPSTFAVLSDPWIASLKGLLFPPVCLLCNRSMGLSESAVICAVCRPGLPFADPAPLPAGGAPIDPLDGSFFLYRYGRLARRLVHRLKMTDDPRAGTWLEAELARLPQPPVSFDAVIPIPSHRRSTRLQPDRTGILWAEALGRRLSSPVRRALRRTRTVPKQTSLGRDRRLAVSESSLLADTGALKGCETVLLADDVWTTGATARSCAQALKRAGVAHVWLAAIARG